MVRIANRFKGLHGGSGVEAGMGLNILSLCRVDKIDEKEKKSGSKQILKKIEIGFDSDDDEPTRFIFKLRRQAGRQTLRRKSWDWIVVVRLGRS